MTELVRIETAGDRVRHVVLNRPERRNALTGPLADAFLETMQALNSDDSISVIVIRGEGGAFCSGLDLKEFGADPQPDWVPRFGSTWRAAHRAIFESDHIIIGALERAAVNGGAALALACDFLIAGDQSFLQVGEVQQGMAAPMNMAWLRLRHTEAVSARIAILGDRILGPELVNLGVALESVPDDQVVEAAQALADRVAGHDPGGISRIKASLRRTGMSMTAEEWFEQALAADPLRGRPMRPIAAEDR